MISEKEVGRVFKYFNKIGVAAVEITNDCLALGDKIHIKGSTTDFEQEVESMQIDGKPVEEVHAGKSVGLKVNERVRPGDKIYKNL
jgi:putative protease